MPKKSIKRNKINELSGLGGEIGSGSVKVIVLI